MTDPHDRLIARLEDLSHQHEQLEQQLADPEVLRQPDRVRELSVRRAAIGRLVERYDRWRKTQRELAEWRQSLEQKEDAELVEMARQQIPDLEHEADDLLERAASELVTAEDRAVGAVILELRAGAGGAEAAIWAGDLLSMYELAAGRHGWAFEPLELSPGDQGGVRHAVVSVRGEGVWQYLGYEGGVHCVKRVPATEAQGRVHTSTATVAVLPEPGRVEVHLAEDEVREHVTTAQGPGGQNVNKVATAVHLIHEPTGVEVRMQETKSQRRNRERAWQVLRARVHAHFQQEAEQERAQTRSKMIGNAGRSERVRTYRYKENIVVDHRLGRSFNLGQMLAGELDELIEGLIGEDRARRLAAL